MNNIKAERDGDRFFKISFDLQFDDVNDELKKVVDSVNSWEISQNTLRLIDDCKAISQSCITKLK